MLGSEEVNQRIEGEDWHKRLPVVTVKADVSHNPAEQHCNGWEYVDEVELSDLALVILVLYQSPLVKNGPVDWNNHEVQNH